MKVSYDDRFFSEGYPQLETAGVAHYSQTQEPISRTPENLKCIGKIINLNEGLRTALVIGCGPNPTSVRELLDRGFDAVGIEPVSGSAAAAARFLREPGRVLQASAESLPVASHSQRIVLMEAVLEHVDSPLLSVGEAYRVLAPGGVLSVYTTNRHKISLSGQNQEFRTPFYNWFPPIVKESYVFQHLHYDPSLAHYTPRPAVHWFTYSELCSLGRTVGFAQFYSLLDLVEIGSPSLRKGFRQWLVTAARTNPWLRAFALTQYGSGIFMWKRNQEQFGDNILQQAPTT